MQRQQTRIHQARMLNKIDEFCDINTHLSFGITELSEYVCMSYYHLTDIFVKLRNASLGSYITTKNLERAAQLCCYTRLNLSDVAEKTGFATKHSLSKAFTNHFGISPGQMARKTLFHPNSPNVYMDGFKSEDAYKVMVGMELLFSYKEVTLENSYLVGNTWQPGANLKVPSETSHSHMRAMLAVEQTLHGERVCLRAFDSLNFSDISAFKFFYGIYIPDVQEQFLQKTFTNYLVTPLKKGRYIVFDIPSDNEHEIGIYITRCRENAIWHKRLVDISDFYDFFLYASEKDKSKAGEYYMYTGR
jgi:AraC-like DNA-binding protein